MRSPIRGLSTFGIVSAGAILLAAALPAAEPAGKETLPSGVTKVRSIEGITEYALSNGLKVLLFPDPSKPKITVNMTVFVGSRHEGYGEAGMAHLLEHMLFKGTPDHPNIPAVLKERGAVFNGSTWVDRTNYFETLPATSDNLKFAIQLEADRLINSYVRGADLKSEMTVVRNEFERGENSPEMILLQRMQAAAYEWHNYGKSTIGNRADIERVPIENLREFYVRYYQPDNAILIVAGKFDPKEALALIAKTFGAIPRPERTLNTTYTEEPAQDGERVVRLRRVGGDVSLIGVMYHVPAGGQDSFAAVEVLEGILSDDPSGRLYKALVQKKLASDVYGLTFSWHDPGVMAFMASVTKGLNPDDVLKAMLDAIDEVAKKGVTEDEVERIKRQILKQRELAAADTGKIAVGLSDWAAQGDWRLYFLHRDRIEKVTAKDVSAAAAKYLKADNRTVGLFLPTKSPDRTAVPMIADLEKSIGDYKGRADMAMGEAFDVSPANIDARTKFQTLPSGVKAALLEKKTRGHAVNLRLKLRYGDVKNLRGTLKAAEMLPDLMIRGTKRLNHQQIQDELDKLKARLTVDGSPGEATFSILTRRETLPQVLRLLGEILRESSLAESEFEILKSAEQGDLEKRLTEPQDLATSTVRQHIAPYRSDDPRYVPSLKESLALVKSTGVGEVKRLYTQYLNGANGELSIVGDFDSAEVVPAVNAMLDKWKAEAAYARINRDLESAISGGDKEIVTPDKANATYFAALVIPLRDDDPDYPALALGNYVLGGASLSSRLGDRIRQKEGLSYGVGSGLQSSALDRRTVMYIYAICNPINMDKVRVGIKEELDRLIVKGIAPSELAASKQGFLQQEQVQRTDDGALAQILGTNLAADRSMTYYANLQKRIEALTSDDIVAAMHRHIDPKALYIVTAGDFRKDQPAAAR